MSDDLYATLGVGREASQEEIKRAYRKLAKAIHPDLNPGSRKRRTVQAGRHRLRHPVRQGDGAAATIAARSTPRAGAAPVPVSGIRRSPGGRTILHPCGVRDAEQLHDIFEGLFGGRGTGRGFRVRRRGADVSHTMTVEFLERPQGTPGGSRWAMDAPSKCPSRRACANASSCGSRARACPGSGTARQETPLVELTSRRIPVPPQGPNIHVELPVRSPRRCSAAARGADHQRTGGLTIPRARIPAPRCASAVAACATRRRSSGAPSCACRGPAQDLEVALDAFVRRRPGDPPYAPRAS